MKKTVKLVLILFVLIGVGCESSKSTASNDRLKNLKDYSQYDNMLQVLQSVPRLRVQGSRIFMEGYSTMNVTNPTPLFVVDGVPISNSLGDLDRLITPVQVESVRTLRGMQASSRYGDQGKYGVVLIKTINASKKR